MRTRLLRRGGRLSRLVCEHDRQADGDFGDLGSQVRKRRFQSFNKAYLQKTELLTGVYGRRNYPSPSIVMGSLKVLPRRTIRIGEGLRLRFR